VNNIDDYAASIYGKKELTRRRPKMPGQKRENFVRLAENRVNAAIKTVRLIGNLSNRGNYSYTTKDVEKIFRTLEQEIKAAKTRFEDGSKDSEKLFKLD